MTSPAHSVEVLATPYGLAGIERESRCFVVIDVLRACTTIAYALDAGARSIIPVESVEDATRLAQTLDRDSRRLCGERDNVRVEGFDLGNSPREFTPDVVADRTLILSTTNGARALGALTDAGRCVAASFVNLGACARFAAAEKTVTIVCAGSGPHFALEDFVCAGYVVERIRELGGDHRLDDGARTALEARERHGGDLEAFLQGTDHGAELAAVGFGADLGLAARIDRFDTVPVLRDGRLFAETLPVG